MSYQVIARKWRPKNFQQLIGQNHVSQTLLNALKNNRLHHALLFNGPRGTGKTSSARILAKSLRCPSKKNFEPCNQCDVCVEISEGRNIDTIEIDGASNNGVDAIRELRDTVKYRPTSGQYKIYIIDEVHMLSTSAFNALLKTLEEPPAHVIFILATTEVQKLPLTILSRVQRFDFRRISTKAIAEHLEHICSRDKIKFEKEALWTIARQGGGSMRDSQSLLDQVTTFCEGSLSLENVINALGLTDRTILLETLESIINRNQQSLIEIIKKIFNSGCDPKLFSQDLLEEIRHITLLKTSKDHSSQLSQIIDLPDSEVTYLKKTMVQTSEEDLHFLFDMTHKGLNDIIHTENPRIVLEMLLLRMVNAPRIESLKEILQAPTSPIAPTPPVVPTSPITSQKEPLTKKAEPIIKKTTHFDSKKSSEDNWFDLVQIVKNQDRVLGAKIENLSLVEKTADTIKLAIPAKLSFLKDQASKPDFLKDIKKYIHSIWQEPLNVEIIDPPSQQNINSAKDIGLEKIGKENSRLDKEVEKHPLVQSAQKVFNAKVQSIKTMNNQGDQK